MPLRLLLLAFAWDSPASAQRVEITAGGRLEHLSEASTLPDHLHAGQRMTVTFLLEGEQEPAAQDAHTATYRPLSATFRLGGRVIPVRDAAFVVERYPGPPIGPAYGYVMRGETSSGWFFSVGIGSTEPGHASDFSIPTELPVGELDFAHDITLRDPQGAWRAYGDATLWKIEARPDSQVTLSISALAQLAR